MRAAAIAACLMLSACGNSGGKAMWSRDEIADIAGDSVDASEASGRLDDVEARLTEIEERLGTQEALTKIVSDDLDSTNKVLSKNARIANENALKDMTRRGACGRHSVQYPSGAISWENKECTLDDMK